MKKCNGTNICNSSKTQTIIGHFYFLLHIKTLFNTRIWIAKTIQILLSWLKNISIVFWYSVALIAVYNKIIYDYREINVIKENLKEKRELKGYYW